MLNVFVIRCMTRRARVRGSPCIVRTIVKRPWGSQRDTKIYYMFINLLFHSNITLRYFFSFKSDDAHGQLKKISV